MKKGGAKILIYDIETAPILGYVWGLWDQNVGLNQIKSDWHVLSWSAKWLGAKEVLYADQRGAKNVEDDRKTLEGLWKLLNEADVVITQNGKSFDQKKLNARFILHGMKPPSFSRHIDTLRIAKRNFTFTSNKLEYLSDKLCTKHKKLKHKQFAGFDLWKECLAGNLAAWKEMERYNRVDVLSTEELYLKLAPWDKSINFEIYYEELANDPSGMMGKECAHPTCHYTMSRAGFFYSNDAKYEKFKCRGCGAEARSKKNLLKTRRGAVK